MLERNWSRQNALYRITIMCIHEAGIWVHSSYYRLWLKWEWKLDVFYLFMSFEQNIHPPILGLSCCKQYWTELIRVEESMWFSIEWVTWTRIIYCTWIFNKVTRWVLWASSPKIMVQGLFCAWISTRVWSSGHRDRNDNTNQECSIKTFVCCTECLFTDSLSHWIKSWLRRFVCQNAPSLSVMFNNALRESGLKMETSS